MECSSPREASFVKLLVKAFSLTYGSIIEPYSMSSCHCWICFYILPASCIIVDFGFVTEKASFVCVSCETHVIMCVTFQGLSFSSSRRLCSAPLHLSAVCCVLASLFPREDLWSTGSGSDKSTIVHVQ